jgi:hypothetical protein
MTPDDRIRAKRIDQFAAIVHLRPSGNYAANAYGKQESFLPTNTRKVSISHQIEM